jgi:hypothetical protein
MKTMLCALALLAASTAFAKSYSITLYQDSIVGTTTLKAGEWRMELKEGKATITGAKQSAESAVKVETGGEKFASTTVRYLNGDGKYRIHEIRIGGTNLKVVFN